MRNINPPRNSKSRRASRRDVLRMGGAAGLAAATGFPLVGVARADSATLKIGYIGCMSGPRTDFGAATPWVLDRVKATVKDGLKIGGKNYAVEFILKDNQSDANQTNVVAKELILGEKCDLVLTGLQSDDHGFGQTGVLIAALLDRPHATIIMAIEAADGKLKLKRELEAGWFQHLECPLPAVLSIQSGINKVRYATLKGIMAAKKKELTVITRESLGVAVEPTQRVERIYVPTKTKKTEFLTGQPKEVAAKLIEKLKFEARVI